jgi:hypothetical protein
MGRLFSGCAPTRATASSTTISSTVGGRHILNVRFLDRLMGRAMTALGRIGP